MPFDTDLKYFSIERDKKYIIPMIKEILKVSETYAATDAIVWPMFYSAVFYLAFVGILTLLFGYFEKKLSYYKV